MTNDKTHKIIRRDATINGVKIQLEDWREVFPTIEKTLKIAAYPLAKNDSYWIRKNESFRLEISRGFSSNQEVLYIYNGLINGDLTLEDLHAHYYDTEKASYYMGIERNK